MKGSVFKRGKRWWYKFSVQGEKFSGSCGPLVKSKSEAQLVLAEKITEAGRYPQMDSSTTVGELIDTWEISTEMPGDREVVRIRRILDSHSSTPCTHYGVEELKAYWRVRVRQVKQSTLHRELSDLSSFFRWAVLNGYCATNPVKALEKPKLKAGPKKPPLEVGQVRACLEVVADDERLSLAYHLAFYLALRRKAIAAARWDWIDWDRAQILMQDGKTGASLGWFDLHAKLQAELLRWRRKEGPIIRNLRDPLAHVDAQHLATLRYRFMQKHEVELPNFHQARHTLGTLLIQKEGISVQEVARMLGHSRTSTTERYYADIKKVTTRKAVDSIDF